MKILITPHDIIERALWQKYQYFILEGMQDLSQEEIDTLVLENKEFELPEKDALVIKLISCIDAPNLKSRLNEHIIHLLATKNTNITHANKSVNCIRKNTISEDLAKFLRNFPSTWEPRIHYKMSLEDLKVYIDELLINLETLNVIEAEVQGNKTEYVQVTHIKKMLVMNH